MLERDDDKLIISLPSSQQTEFIKNQLFSRKHGSQTLKKINILPSNDWITSGGMSFVFKSSCILRVSEDQLPSRPKSSPSLSVVHHALGREKHVVYRSTQVGVGHCHTLCR